ncbi:MAG: MBL fold metallo-hydrolase [Bacillota bacterium]
MIKIDKLELGPIRVNCYVVREEKSDTCVVIDPADAEPIRRFLEKNALVATHILITHGHFDHILGVSELKRLTGASVCIHEKDARALHDDGENLGDICGYSVPPSEADRLLFGGEVIEAAGLRFEALFTPGHSPGGVCYVERDERAIFSGDTLFFLSVGRMDFPGSDGEELYRSIRDGLFALPTDYKVYPGHMRETTLEFERKHNPFMLRDRGRI